MNKGKKNSSELREQAARMVLKDKKDHDSQWGAIRSISEKAGCTAETLRHWVRQAERDSVRKQGRSSREQQRGKELEREDREIKRANEILREAAAYFALAEFDRRREWWFESSTTIETFTGSSRSAACSRLPR